MATVERSAAERRLRATLWASVAFNAFGAVVFLQPALGFGSSLIPLLPPPFYAAQMAFVIALFGGAYLWMARQAEIPRSLVVLSGIGKLGFFVLFVIYAAVGDLPALAVLQTAPDAVFAMIFFDWARRPA